MEGHNLEVRENGKRIYNIVIRNSFSDLPDQLKELGISKRKICIFTEDMVGSLYLDQIMELLTDQCAHITSFIFKHGEESKNLDTVSDAYRFLIEKNFDRKDLLIALGGGVTGDLTGFVAATYLRGVDFVQLPTSLLSQVDSSIGGKTGVDYAAYKNMVGAFYMPKLVYINIATLQTLSELQFKSGLGEVIKHGLIRDKEYFDFIVAHKEEIRKREAEVMAKIVEGSCAIKRGVVEEDPRELGIRAYLNFGHTIGHAVEKLMNFTMTHGECVGMGTVAASRISYLRGYLTAKEYADIVEIYGYFGFSSIPETLESDAILETMKHDKKMEHGVLKFILLNSIGDARIYRDVTDAEVCAAITGETSHEKMD